MLKPRVSLLEGAVWVLLKPFISNRSNYWVRP